jgi:hypothetical protein
MQFLYEVPEACWPTVDEREIIYMCAYLHVVSFRLRISASKLYDKIILLADEIFSLDSVNIILRPMCCN